jgi:hypothetical protein
MEKRMSKKDRGTCPITLRKVKQAMDEGKFIRFTYINSIGQRIRNVTARVHFVRDSFDMNHRQNSPIAELGIIAGSDAHHGSRQISVSRMRSVRILKSDPSKIFNRPTPSSV